MRKNVRAVKGLGKKLKDVSAFVSKFNYDLHISITELYDMHFACPVYDPHLALITCWTFMWLTVDLI